MSIKGKLLSEEHKQKISNSCKGFDINNGVTLCFYCHQLTKRGRPKI